MKISQICFYKTSLRNLLIQCSECFQQYQILLQCSPDSSFPTETPLVRLSHIASLSYGDETWTDISQIIQGLNSDVANLLKKFQHRPSSTLLSWSEAETLQTAYHDVSGWMEKISSVLNMCEDEVSVFNESLIFVKGQMELCQEQFATWFERVDSIPSGSDETGQTTEWFQKKTEKLATSILLVIQDLFKAHVLDQEGEDTGSEEGELGGGKFVEVSQSRLGKDVQNLNMKKITKRVTNLKKKLTEMSAIDLNLTAQCTTTLTKVLPFLAQYTTLVQFYLTQQVATHRASCKMLSVLLGIFTELAQKGFCLPAEFSDELGGEGATQFEDIEGGGLGEGEGVKDVSDQIENEDQLEDTRREGEEKQEDSGQQPDVESEENAIEMSEDFGGKLQDVEQTEGDGDSGSEDSDDEEKLDKQMGDVDQNDADKLDERIWGSDDEDDQPEEKEKEEEFGPGAGDKTESELVAKDDNKDKTPGDDEQKKEEGNEEQQEKEKTHNMDNIDESEYDENQIDPYYGKEEERPPEGEEGMDLPENMEIDDEGDDKEEGEKENPHDIDNMDTGEETEVKEQEPSEEQMETEEQEGEGQSDEGEGREEEQGQDEGQEAEGQGQEEEAGAPPDESKVEEEAGGEDRGDAGLQPQPEEEEGENPETEEKTDDVAMAAENYGTKEHDTQDVQQSEAAKDQAGKTDSTEEQDGVGVAEAENQSGHEGQASTHMAVNMPSQAVNKPISRQPGKTDNRRTLGSVEETINRRLQTVDTQESQDTSQEDKEPKSDLYEHIKQGDEHYDSQTLDAATAEQMEEQPQVDLEGDKIEDEQEDVKMHEDKDEDLPQPSQELKPLSTVKPKPSTEDGGEGEKGEEMGEGKAEVEGERLLTMTVQRGAESTIHTDMDIFNEQVEDVEKLREELEQQLTVWSHPVPESSEQQKLAEEAWHQYENITGNLAQELCEQLRLVLEPTQATKLRGDYRTGKRLNMRKVIPYIASQFRKDKIWLRRTKPSKRQYQIMLAVDDSSSMVDNHSKQLAFESLSVVANALTLLEVGELAVCSFGETMELLHPFHEQFSSQSGARILTKFTFEQKKTKIAQLLKDVTKVMLNARSSQGGSRSGDISQLLMIVSDGRGLFLEGMEVVKSAVRQAKHTNIFTVFIIIDNPENKDSILDIRVPVFKSAGQFPEIKSYMDHFPFPFYIILRDINSLPHILSDALRQWFELITALDR